MIFCCTLVLLIVELVLVYPPEEKVPSVQLWAQPLAALGGSVYRRNGSTGPTRDASSILVPYYMEIRTGSKIQEWVVVLGSVVVQELTVVAQKWYTLISIVARVGIVTTRFVLTTSSALEDRKIVTISLRLQHVDESLGHFNSRLLKIGGRKTF